MRASVRKVFDDAIALKEKKLHQLGALKAQACLRNADKAVHHGCLHSAEQHLRTALRYFSFAGKNALLDVAECLTLLGIVLSRLDKFDEAEKCLRDAIDLAPDARRHFREIPLFALWRMLLRLSRFHEADALELQLEHRCLPRVLY